MTNPIRSTPSAEPRPTEKTLLVKVEIYNDPLRANRSTAEVFYGEDLPLPPDPDEVSLLHEISCAVSQFYPDHQISSSFAAYRTTATAPTTDFAEKFTVECELEDNGQWLAEVMQANGAMAYGQQPSEAILKALEIARIERYEPAAPVPLPEPELANRVSEWISVERIGQLVERFEGEIQRGLWDVSQDGMRHVLHDLKVIAGIPLPSPPTVPEEKK